MADPFGASHVHGLRVAIEFFPPTNVPDVRTAMELVIASRRDVGLCVDTWHHFRGAHDWVALGALTADHVASIQINDGAHEPTVADYLEDTLSPRVAPGAGDFDLVRFVRALDSMGVVAPYSVEVISTTPAAPDPAALATLLADRTRRVLGEARNRAAG